MTTNPLANPVSREPDGRLTEDLAHSQIRGIWFTPPLFFKTECSSPNENLLSPKRRNMGHPFLCLCLLANLSLSLPVSPLYITRPEKLSTNAEPTIEFRSAATLSYVRGCPNNFIEWDVFKLEATFRSHLITYGPLTWLNMMAWFKESLWVRWNLHSTRLEDSCVGIQYTAVHNIGMTCFGMRSCVPIILMGTNATSKSQVT